MPRLLPALIAIAGTLAACTPAPGVRSNGTAAVQPARVSGIVHANFDPAVRPQDDFYRHVNGRWLAATEIPPDRSNYGTFTLLAEEAEQNLREILEEAAMASGSGNDPDAQRIGDFYASFMDEAGIEALGVAPLAEEWERIGGLAGPADIARYIGHTQRIGVHQPLGFYVAIDRKDSTSYVSYIAQSGLGMPDRDYYLSDEPRYQAVRQQYQAYIRDLLAAAGAAGADTAAARILAFETRLARAHWTRVENRDVEKTYNRFDLATARELAPDLDWPAFLDGAGARQVSALVVLQPSFVQTLGRMLGEVPVADWQTYFRFKLLNAWAPYLPARFVQLHFEFNGRVLSGTAELRPRWKRGVDAVEGSIGELAGRRYVERHFSPESKRRMDQLVGNLQAAFAAGIDELQWMTPATRRAAREKLAGFTAKIGYPDRWKDWSALEVRRDDLIGNVRRAAQLEHDRAVARLGGPIDRTEWLMTPQTVNAYYYPPANEIVFPAAILQPPFFNVAADDAVNYGAIGAVIGHEISHGFDDQGRHYDGAGNLRGWWTEEDDREFRRLTAGLVEQYGAYAPLEGARVNGELTLGENIADLSGLAVAYRAYRLSLGDREAPVIDGFTGDQRFFIGWAQVWARKHRDDDLRRRLLTDSHSPTEYRANGVLINMPAFQRAFGVRPGDGMYRPAGDQIRIW